MGTDVPTPSKQVKYQTLKDDIELHFPHRTYNDIVVKGFIKEAFPMSSTKRLGKLRHTHVLGIETKPGDSHTSAASLEDVVQLQLEEQNWLRKDCVKLQKRTKCSSIELTRPTSSIVGVRFITPTLINICTFLGVLT